MHRPIRDEDPQLLLGIDLETYWDSACSVAKLGVTEYIRHPDFAIHGAAVSVGPEAARWVSGSSLPGLVLRIAAAQARGLRVYLLAHNTNFDGLVLAHKLGFVADRYIDTSAMAAAAGVMGRSLADVSAALGIGRKDTSALVSTKSIAKLDPAQSAALARYSENDLELARRIYVTLLPYVSEAEMEAISWTTWAAAIEPFQADPTTAEAVLRSSQEIEDALVDESGLSRDTLSSSAKLAERLASRGIEVETKIGKAGPIPQLAKTDPWMRDMLSSADHETRAALRARLALRSTLVRTRGALLLSLARHGTSFGAVLKAYGAHTGRWSGGDKLNFPNLPGPGSAAGGGELSRIIRPRPFDDQEVWSNVSHPSETGASS